jgi:hypothetical protein
MIRRYNIIVIERFSKAEKTGAVIEMFVYNIGINTVPVPRSSEPDLGHWLIIHLRLRSEFRSETGEGTEAAVVSYRRQVSRGFVWVLGP